MLRNRKLNYIFGGVFMGFGIAAYAFMFAAVRILRHMFIAGFSHSLAGWFFLAFPAIIGLTGFFLLMRARKSA